MTTKDVATKPTAEVDKRAAVIAVLQRKLDQVPGSSGDGLTDIFEQLLSAERIEDLDRPWNAEGLRDFLDKPVLVTAIKKVPSDFADGPGYFLVADGAVASSGEVMSFTTSAIMVMTQLVIAHTNGWLPRIFIPRQADKPTEDGYYPMHLEVYRGPDPKAEQEPVWARTERLVAERKARTDAAAAHGLADAAGTVPAARPAAEAQGPAF